MRPGTGGNPVVTLISSPSWPSTTLRSRMKPFVHRTRFSSKPAFLIFRRRHPLATLRKAAATSVRRAPVMTPRFQASWACAMATPTASTADCLTLHFEASRPFGGCRLCGGR